MELEAFKQLWSEHDRRLDASLHLNTVLLQRANLGRVEKAMGSQTRSVVVELLVNAIAVLLIGSFAAAHVREPGYLTPAAILWVYAIALIAENVRQIAVTRSIDYDEPVVAIAKHLATLRVRRIHIVQVILATAPLLWAPLLIVGLRGVFGVDAYTALGAAYLVANFAFGLAFLAAAVWVSKRYAGTFEHSPFLRSLADDLAGRSLTEALHSLDTIARFEYETEAA